SQVKVVPALAVIGPLQIMNVLVCTHVQDQLASANGVKKACKGSAIGNRDATAQRSQVKVVPALAVVRPLQIVHVLVCTHIHDQKSRVNGVDKAGERSAIGNRHSVSQRRQVKAKPALAVVGPLQIVHVLVCTDVEYEAARINSV